MVPFDARHNVKVAGTAAILFLAGLGALASEGELSIVQFFVMLASAGSLGVVSSVLLTIIRAIFVGIKSEYAMLGSFFAATVVSMVARAVLPFIESVPAEATAYWPTIVWLAQQIWYALVKDRINGFVETIPS